MAYQHIEELRNRKNEKIALFLTAENFAGLLAVGLPVYLLTANVESLWLRLPAVAMAAMLGITVTLDAGGMALYERLLWLVRGRLRRLVRGCHIRPAQFTGAQHVLRRRPLAAVGKVRPLPYHSAPTASDVAEG